jgi:rare lipoprotein A
MDTRRGFVALCVALVLVAVPLFAWASHDSFKGDAIYYSNIYKGETMACGGKYQPWKMVAAHRKLPCGTRLRVRNLANDKVVTVTVRDRGPYGDSETKLDVSRRAAKKLDFISAGRARVKATILHD